jgi:two-component system NtrC family sensor kinase
MASRGFVRRFLDKPLRLKLILSFLAVIAVGGIITLFIGTRIENHTIMSLAEARVSHDLASAWMVYHEKLNSIRDIVELSSRRKFLVTALQSGNTEGVAAELDATRRQFGLDVLTVTDSRGRVAARGRRPEASGTDESRDPFVTRALEGKSESGTAIVSRADLLEEGPSLAQQAYFRIVPTPMAAARPDDHEENGMMIKAASPVEDGTGRIIGVLYGGVLFNHNYQLVDEVKDIVFKGEKYKGHDIGTATLFQRDLRISTNVLDDKGNRAIGTRVSREVNEAVLEQGHPYVGRAFVVNAWYITAYEPIRDIGGRIVGMLYVGMLEKPYIDLRNRVMATFAGLAGLCTIFLIGLLAFVAGQITRPLAVMVEATDRIARGDLNYRVEISGQDEIGRLAQEFNSMTDDLRNARENLTEWGRTLERRVEERTRQLREAEDQLIQSEKLASLGKMAAGVAHEINNPLTSIILNTHLLLEEKKEGDEEREPLTLVADEAARCAQIVSGLLNFARQTPAASAPADVNDIVERAVQLLEMQASVRNIRIERDTDPSLPLIKLDRNKIQQVFSNLTLNACEAMPRGGTLRITSRMSRDGTAVEIVFADTGVGIPRENIPKLFDPFFTTKSFGTGLGLAVSYGIVRQRGGTIDVRSEVGRGATFTVRLPLEEKPEEPDREEASS